MKTTDIVHFSQLRARLAELDLNLKTMEDNKIIAEFMGCTHPFNEVTDATLYEISHGTFELSELKYHASWDWLMQVVNQCYTSNMQHPNDDITQGLIDVDIEATYKSVVEFIKEYKKS